MNSSPFEKHRVHCSFLAFTIAHSKLKESSSKKKHCVIHSRLTKKLLFRSML